MPDLKSRQAVGQSVQHQNRARSPPRRHGTHANSRLQWRPRWHHSSVVASLGIQAADALEHAHQLGIVHRDIKPSNLMVDATGHLWITDFGLATGNTITGPTLTGDMLGTLRYMSPEQATGERRMPDGRTDIYSLA